MTSFLPSLFLLLTIVGFSSIHAFPYSVRNVNGFEQQQQFQRPIQGFQQQQRSTNQPMPVQTSHFMTPQEHHQTIEDPSGFEQAAAFGNVQPQQQQSHSLEQPTHDGLTNIETGTPSQGSVYNGQQSSPIAQSPPLEQQQTSVGTSIVQTPIEEELPPLEQPTPIEQSPVVEQTPSEPIDKETDSTQIIVESLTEAQRSHLISYFICEMCRELQVSMCTRMCQGEETDGSGSGAEIEASGDEMESSGQEEPSIIIVVEETGEASGQSPSSSSGNNNEASGNESESSGFGESEGSGDN